MNLEKEKTMYKKIVIFSLIMVCSLGGFAFAPAGEDEGPQGMKSVSGVIREIDSAGGYIVVDEEKIITTPELVEEAYFDIGDNVTIFIEDTAAGPQAVDYEYNGSLEDEELYYYDDDTE